MRVIAGSARRLPLKAPAGLDTRPTTDRIKETLFNMLQNDIYGCSFLDLFSGSGAIGIEALSRGAKDAVFVENNREALACIRDNLSFTHLLSHAVVMGEDCVSAIRKLAAQNRSFDIIFMDPPYQAGIEYEVLDALKGTSLVHEDTIIIIEAQLETELDEAEDYGFEIYKVKEYKTNKHFFLSLMTD